MIDFLAMNLAIILFFAVGTILLVVEVFMPGFGIAGISGIVLEVISIVLTFTQHGPFAALGLTILVLALIGVVISITLRSATKGRLANSPFVLKKSETSSDGYSATNNKDMDVFIGKEGVVVTTLRPVGMAEIEGVKVNVDSDGEFIPKGTPVRVTRVDGLRVIVRKINPPA
ncbi:MAG TPA: NfeD family protein [Candidatus Limiplasma sp.]|nr:NfeD family protein [Candidatus Limiplasma sp.]